MPETEWQRVAVIKPPLDTPVETRIDDASGLRNEAILKYRNNLWWFQDDSMYVYYTPTHWRAVTNT